MTRRSGRTFMLLATTLLACDEPGPSDAEAPPTLTVTILPDDPTPEDPLTASVLPDRPAEDLAITWQRTAPPSDRRDPLTGPVLPADLTAPGDQWRVQVTAYDPRRPAAPLQLATASVTIGDPLPPEPGDLVATLTPDPPTAEVDDLRCTASHSPFGELPLPEDALLEATWTVDDHPIDPFDDDDDTTRIPATWLRAHETWACTLTLQRDGDTITAEPVATTVEPRVPIHVTDFPAGDFMMGANPDTVHSWIPNNHFWRSMALSRDFEIGTYEVTQAQWAARGISTEDWTDPTCTTCAAGGISYDEAARFLNELSREAGLTPCYTCIDWGCVGADGGTYGVDSSIYTCEGYRMPTAVEWEYAARDAGHNEGRYTHPGNWLPLDTIENYYLPWGDDTHCDGLVPATLDSGVPVASFAWNCTVADRAQPVGLLAPNAYGLHDVLGNVTELNHEYSFISGIIRSEECPTTDCSFHTGQEGPRGDYAMRGGSYIFRPYLTSFDFYFGFGLGGNLDSGLRIARTLPSRPFQLPRPTGD